MNIYQHKFTWGGCRRVVAGLILSILPIMQASAADLINMSARSYVGDDKQVIGFISTGAGDQQYFLFGVGPIMEDFGVDNVLDNPKITLIDSNSGEVIDSNDNWKDHPSSSLVNEVMKELGWNLDDLEAAMVLDLGEGNYTLQVEGVDGSSGVALGGVSETSVDAPRPPDDVNPDNVCERELCATNEAAAQQCKEFLENCLKVEDEDECVGGALLICGTI